MKAVANYGILIIVAAAVTTATASSPSQPTILKATKSDNELAGAPVPAARIAAFSPFGFSTKPSASGAFPFQAGFPDMVNIPPCRLVYRYKAVRVYDVYGRRSGAQFTLPKPQNAPPLAGKSAISGQLEYASIPGIAKSANQIAAKLKAK